MGVEVVVLREHELLGSEQRGLDKFVAGLSKQGLAARHCERVAPERVAELHAWLDTVDPKSRRKLPSKLALGDSAAVIVLRMEPPQRRVAKGMNALAVLVRGPKAPILWMHLDGASQPPLGQDPKLIAALVKNEKGALR